ncbi:hypothetical protein [Mycolicibacterium brisbanense]
MASDSTARVFEVRALAQVLWFLPPPARPVIADKLHGLGVRVHPELATLQLERTGPAAMGNHAQQQPVTIDRDTGLRFLRGSGNPKLQEMADRIEAADTEEKRAAERARLEPLIGDSIRTVTEHVENVDPEDLE